MKKINLIEEWEAEKEKLMEGGFYAVIDYVEDLQRKIEQLRSTIAILRVESFEK